MTNRFHPKLEQALRELAGLPWEITSEGLIRCEGACPLSAAGIAAGGEPEWRDSVAGPAARLGVSFDEAWAVAYAADLPRHPLRPRLLELLGMEETK